MIWILTIDWAGSRWVWASDLSAVPAEAKPSHAILPLPVPGWALEANRAGDPPAPPEGATIDLAWPGVAALEAEGHVLESAEVELSMLEEGEDWVSRDVLFSGPLPGGDYGHSGEPVTVELRPRPWEDAGLFPDPGQRVAEDTWPSVGGSEGRGYPVVIGTPGIYQRSNGSDDTCSGSPCLPVGSDIVIVASHRVASTTLDIYSPTDDTHENFPVDYMLDSADQEVAFVDLSAAASITSDPSYAYYAWWTDGAMTMADGTPLQTAGDVIAWALRQSSLEVDSAAMEAIRAPLAGFHLAGFSDEPVSPWEWLNKEILPLLPVTLLQGPRGIRPVLWRPPSAPLAIDSLSVDRGEVGRDGRISRVGTPVNDISIRYAWSARTGGYLRSRRISGDGTGNISSEIAQKSFHLLKRRVGETIQSQWLYDLLTVDKVLLSKLEILQPRRAAAIMGAHSRLRYLRPLDVVLFSDASMSLIDQPALIRRVEKGPTEARLILEF